MKKSSYANAAESGYSEKIMAVRKRDGKRIRIMTETSYWSQDEQQLKYRQQEESE